MALHIEQVLDDLREYSIIRIKAALEDVIGQVGHDIPLSVPERKNHFVGQEARYHAYEAPAVFIVADRTNRPGVDSNAEYGVTQHQKHGVMFNVVIESTSEDELTRKCYRYAEAYDQVLHNAEFTQDRAWLAQSKVVRIDYGPMYTGARAEQRTFRKDITLSLTIKHEDLLTPQQ